MAKTWHHDRIRFHPWDNPRSHQHILEEFRERWQHPGSGNHAVDRQAFHHVDYSKPGPGWFRRLAMEKPARRQKNMKAATFRGVRWFTFKPCCAVLEGRVRGWLHCPGCCEDVLALDELDYGVWPWPQGKKPKRYRW